MSNWTATEMPDQTGRTFIVTGGNSGLGYESVRALVKKGATVIMASRTAAKAKKAITDIKAETSNADVTFMQVDMANLSSVREFAAAFNANYDRLDVLMNNAGIMATPYHKTADGFESQLGTNHFGHYALTGLLMDKLRSTPNSRVVNIASMAASSGTMNFDDLAGEQSYDPIRAYSQSKLANLLFTNELKRRVAEAGYDMKIVAAHPGGSSTNLADGASLPFIFRLIFPVVGLLMMSAEQGALSQLYASTVDSVASGDYYGPTGMGGMRGYPNKVDMPAAAHIAADNVRFWEISEELTGVKYDFA